MSRAFTDINSFNVSNITFTSTDHEPRLLAWLSPLEPQVAHRDICEQQVGGVGDQLLKKWRSLKVGIMVERTMDLIMRVCSVRATRVSARAIAGKRSY